MKIKESHWHEASKADKNDNPSRTRESGKQNFDKQTDAAIKTRQSESTVKDASKFASMLETAPKTLKPNTRREDSGEERSGNQKSEKKHSAHEKNSAENAAEGGKTDKNESYGGQTGGGGQSGFDTGGNVSQLNLSDNFAARSILHIADLERLVSTIRTQTDLGGRREITLQLKRSVLEGLKVKITTDPAARVQIEFLAANEKVRAKIAEHSQELSEILRGRGINLGTMQTSVESSSGDGERQNRESFAEESGKITSQKPESAVSPNDEMLGDNTFAADADSRIYNA